MLLFINMETIFIFGILFVYMAFVSMSVHKCVGIHVSTDIYAIICSYAWACLWQLRLSLGIFFFPTLYFEEDFWLNSDPLYFTSLTHHRVSNRVPPESWDYRSASIPAYCLCEGWRPECQTSCFDAKYFNYWDIPQSFFLYRLYEFCIFYH